MEKDKYVFFWDGIYSNWYPSPFTIKNITYGCGEQWMMYQKALLFQDLETASAILKSDNPRMQKKLGREIKGFDETRWNSIKLEIVKDGLREKFNQNPTLKEELISNKGKLFVEASPYDRIWGIGFSEMEAMQNMEHWGENLLGKILTELSIEL